MFGASDLGRLGRRDFMAGAAALLLGERAGAADCGKAGIDWAMLDTLRTRYRLDDVVAGSADDLDRVRRLSRWTRSRWQHNGENEPSRPDPLTILAEADAGRRFRCVEYAEVLAAALSAVGVPARVLGLQRADVETAESGAGHVVAEAWLRDGKRWALVDGQWDAIAMRGAVPLNARELQDALATEDARLAVQTFSGIPPSVFERWIAPYLHFYVTKGRRWTTGAPDGTKSLMLVPPGATAPQVFQRRFPQSYDEATASVGRLYAPPPRCRRLA